MSRFLSFLRGLLPGYRAKERELAEDAARRAAHADTLKEQVENRTERTVMISVTSKRLAETNRIAAMIRDAMLNADHHHAGGNK